MAVGLPSEKADKLLLSEMKSDGTLRDSKKISHWVCLWVCWIDVLVLLTSELLLPGFKWWRNEAESLVISGCSDGFELSCLYPCVHIVSNASKFVIVDGEDGSP